MFDFFISKFFGYALGYFFDMTGNYGIAVILFTIVISVVLFPLSIKRYKTTLPNLKFEAKKNALKRQCGKDTNKFQDELAELSKKEGVNPLGGGCLNVSFILTFIIFGGVYSTIQKPLVNVLHLSNDKVSEAIGMLTEEQKAQKGTDQLDIVRSFKELRPKLTMFSEEELNKIGKLSSGFELWGLNLLNSPKSSPFMSFMWILPLLSLVFTSLGTYINQLTNPMAEELEGAAKYIIYVLPLIQVWIVYKVFAAVGLYFVMSSIFNIFQSLALEHFFSPYIKLAKKEKERFENLVS